MYKLKTKRAAAKRFKATGSGKIRRNQAFMRHILTKKSSKRKSQLKNPALVAAVDVPNVKRMIPYA
ncbi:50S ribosomal protein L35 [Desulfurispirillum indicum]|uniref:Large ribosomal subunit protein bL35 n=1 Tax=Desulfurispirillum indicum (strain ATCC BAA-1389 / DSM 22839 / S5) TaxID=653733 RepID=E6W565_DESIS|nr:50S ribosomal protein L35 [Desulfurispirillum indicum]ADU67144.1 ribosomal protein L35 [Desulfurispirillum indicum S5]UCZ56468.1 50S ribosomal protein L35 [Desulfurispirillum indicum]